MKTIIDEYEKKQCEYEDFIVSKKKKPNPSIKFFICFSAIICLSIIFSGCGGGGGDLLPHKTITDFETYIPDAVNIFDLSEIKSSSMYLSWTQSNDSNFASYKIYGATSSGVSQTSTFVSSITNKMTTSLTVSDLTTSTKYYFKVYVCNTKSLCTGSNEINGITTADEETVSIKYNGVKGCIACHKKMDDSVSIWEDSNHAKAYNTLVSDAAKRINPNAQNDSDCLKCHVTGLEKEGGYWKSADDYSNEFVRDVTCEACHGPGKVYAKLMMKAMKTEIPRELFMDAGLIIPNENTCKSCHNEESPTKVEFNYEEMLNAIKHGEKIVNAE